MTFVCTVYPNKYAHGFCFAVLCCGYTLTDFPISIRLTSLALWQSNDCPSASKATLMNMDTYFMWIHYERLHNHNKAKHNKTVCIFLGIYCISMLCFSFYCAYFAFLQWCGIRIEHIGQYLLSKWLMPDGTKTIHEKCSTIISHVLWHSHRGIFISNARDVHHW